MKKVILSIFLILICYLSKAQFPLTQNLGSSSTLVQVPANGGLRAGLINRVFTDTTSANLSNLDFYDGAQIKTLSPVNAVWWRDSTNSTWVQILPAGGTSGTFAWKVGGNNMFPGSSGNQIFGITSSVNSNYGIDFRTRNATRFILDSTGILATAGTVKPLGIDSVTGILSYASGGTAGWELTGNAGTTAGTNFIGTTDNVGLMFKVNGAQAGYLDIGEANTSFGYRSLIGKTTGEFNVAVGESSLESTTSGDANTAIGYTSMFSNVTGVENIAVGQSALYSSTGSANIALGHEAGYYNTSQDNRLYINSIYRSNILGDTTKSIIYGAQDATAANQRLYLNSQVYLPYAAAAANAADSMMVILPSTGKVGYRAIPTSSGGTVTGSGTTNYLPKWSSSTALGNSVMYDDGTNIGIGTATPSVKLDVVGDGIIGKGGTWTDGLFKTDYTNSKVYQGDYTGIDTYAYTLMDVGGSEFSINNSSIIVNSGNLYLSSAGSRIGIGTASPTVALDVVGDVNVSDTISSLSLTASEIVITDGSKNLVSAPVATYPSLTELALIKGLTSTSTKLNYLTSATGTTGTTSTNLVFSGSPAITGSPTITGTPAGAAALLTVTAGGGFYSADFLNAAGDNYMSLGYQHSSTNAAVFHFGYAGLNSTSNYFGIGNYGSFDQIKLTADGTFNVGGNTYIGSNSTVPTSTLQTGGSFATAYRAITALRTLDATDHTINCTANTFTVTLPTAASIAGRQYTIVNSGAGVITIGTTSSQTFTNINGTPTTLTLDAVAASAVTSYTVVSNGANWIVVSKVINP